MSIIEYFRYLYRITIPDSIRRKLREHIILPILQRTPGFAYEWSPLLVKLLKDTAITQQNSAASVPNHEVNLALHRIRVNILEDKLNRLGLSDVQIRNLHTSSRDTNLGYFPLTVQKFPDNRPGRLQHISTICRMEHFLDPSYHIWCARIGESFAWRRKQWEYVFICQTLFENELLIPGNCGLGFGVGREPMPDLFAAMGCRITATDIPSDDSQTGVWQSTAQHSSTVTQLNTRKLCDPERFHELVTFREVDMNCIPENLTGFDFLWSSCALEHLGDLKSGINFVLNSMKCLKPGGIAVHTTEFNVSSEENTVEKGPTVLYRKNDLLDMARQLERNGHEVAPFDFSTGEGLLDRFVDEAQSSHLHLKLWVSGFVVTSVGFIVKKSLEARDSYLTQL